MRTRVTRSVVWAAVVISVVVIIVGLYITNTKATEGAREAANATPATTTAFIKPPYVAVLGDSYTGGSLMNQHPETWIDLLIPRLNIARKSFSVGGSGFVSGGSGNKSFGSRVPELISTHPGIVVIEGGHNDGAFPEADVRTAADKVLADLAAGLPSAKLVVLGPIWPNSDVPPAMQRINANLKGLAAQYGAVFVDPIAGGWFTGQYARLVGSDGTHPTDAGHAHLADLMAPVLQPLLEKLREG